MQCLAVVLAAISAYAPETWFHIIDGNASKEGIAADIEAIAEAGIGGIQFFHGGWGGAPWPGVKEPIPCLSEKWVELVKFAETECHKRGLTFKMQNCPGWSMSGGPWITPDKAMRILVAFEPGKGPKWDKDDDYHEIGAVTFPAPDASRDGELMRVFPNPQQICHAWAYEPKTNLWGRPCPPGAWQDSAPMTFAKHGASHLDMWEAKAGWGLRRFEMSTNVAPVKTVGTKTLVFGHVNARRRNTPAPKEATGWECDKMDPRGFEANWNGYLGKLVKQGVKIDGTLVDSWECGCQTWTWKMEEEFEKRCGYKLRPWLPALFGYVLKSEAETEKFLLDWRNTCSRLIEENYYGTIARLARENGMTVQYETAFGDVIPGDILRYWKYADEPMCEFWSPFDNEKGFVGSHDFKPVRPCVSAAHIYGKKRVSAEAFTSFQLTYNETFQELKENADRHFSRGVTHLVFHTYTHNPVVGDNKRTTARGMGDNKRTTTRNVVASMQGTIGTPFNRVQPWWKYMREFTCFYLEKCCRELERGLPVVDILWYLGDDVNHKPSERDDLFNNQYKYDYCNNDALMTRVEVKNGRLVFPDGMSYRVLWIPNGTFILPSTEAKLAELEKEGARVIRGDFKPDWPAQIAIDGDLAWYERVEEDVHLYFVATRGAKAFGGKVAFRCGASLDLALEPGESRFIEVRDWKVGMMNPANCSDYLLPSCEVMRSWSEPGEMLPVTGWSRPLGAWTDGMTEGRYVAAVRRPKTTGRILLDLGKVCSWATVSVNGKTVEMLWCRPYRCDVTDYLKDGDNEIVVEITSTIHNQLALDAAKPEAERRTWALGGPKAGAPLADAGLYGPVTLKVVK